MADHAPPAAPSAASLAAPLAASLRPRHVAMISLGGVVGAGLFVGSSTAIQNAGPAVMLAYLLAGTVSFLMMRMLGEMAVARPGEGSFNSYIRLSLGPSASFVSGWLYWYFWVIVVGAETIAGASLIHDWMPPAQAALAPVWAIGLVLIGLMTLTNLMSVKSYGEFEFWFSLLKVGAIGLFIVGGLLWMGYHAGSRAAVLGNLTRNGGFAPHGLLAVLATVPVVLFSLTGSEIASIAAAESDDPPRNVARASRTVALRILMFYIAAIFVIVCIVPWSDIRSGHSPFVTAMDVMGIPGGQTLMRLIVLVAVLSCLNSGLYVTSRILRELAANGDAPASLVRTGARQIPIRAILAGSGFGFLACIASILSPELVFAFLLNTSGAVILVIYGMIAAAQIRARQAMQARHETPQFAMWWFPWLSYAAIAAMASVLVAMAILPDQRVQVAASLLSVAVVVVACRVHHGRRRPLRRPAWPDPT